MNGCVCNKEKQYHPSEYNGFGNGDECALFNGGNLRNDCQGHDSQYVGHYCIAVANPNFLKPSFTIHQCTYSPVGYTPQNDDCTCTHKQVENFKVFYAVFVKLEALFQEGINRTEGPQQKNNYGQKN